VILVAVLDDHPAVLAGLRRLIARSPDLEAVAVVETDRELMAALDRSGADVVVVDYDLARGDGLAVCQRLKSRPRPPAVVIYSAYAGPALAVTTRLAQADALVNKSEPVSALLSAVREVAGGRTVLPDIALELRHAVLGRLDDGGDVAIAAMLLAGTSRDDIAEALGLERREVTARSRRIVARLRSDDAGDPRRTPAHGAGTPWPARPARPIIVP
jgi:two-component system, NarL family, response regulator DevR